MVGRGEWIRTTDLLVPNQHLSTTVANTAAVEPCSDPASTLVHPATRTSGLVVRSRNDEARTNRGVTVHRPPCLAGLHANLWHSATGRESGGGKVSRHLGHASCKEDDR